MPDQAVQEELDSLNRQLRLDQIEEENDESEVEQEEKFEECSVELVGEDEPI